MKNTIFQESQLLSVITTACHSFILITLDWQFIEKSREILWKVWILSRLQLKMEIRHNDDTDCRSNVNVIHYVNSI